MMIDDPELVEQLQLYAEALVRARRIAGELLDECNDPDVRGAAAKLADTLDGDGWASRGGVA